MVDLAIAADGSIRQNAARADGKNYASADPAKAAAERAAPRAGIRRGAREKPRRLIHGGAARDRQIEFAAAPL